MDFVSDALFDGRRLRALTLLDVHTREALAIRVDQGVKGEQVIAVLDAVAVVRGAPRSIRVDNVLTDQSRGSDQTTGLVTPAMAGRC